MYYGARHSHRLYLKDSLDAFCSLLTNRSYFFLITNSYVNFELIFSDWEFDMPYCLIYFDLDFSLIFKLRLRLSLNNSVSNQDFSLA